MRRLLVPVTSTKSSASDETENEPPNKKRKIGFEVVDVDKVVFTNVQSPKPWLSLKGIELTETDESMPDRLRKNADRQAYKFRTRNFEDAV